MHFVVKNPLQTSAFNTAFNTESLAFYSVKYDQTDFRWFVISTTRNGQYFQLFYCFILNKIILSSWRKYFLQKQRDQWCISNYCHKKSTVKTSGSNWFWWDFDPLWPFFPFSFKDLASVHTHLVKVVSNDLPDPGPLQPDAPHVVIRDLNYLLQAEHTWMCRRGQLIHGHGTQPAHKIHWRTGRKWLWWAKKGVLNKMEAMTIQNT